MMGVVLQRKARATGTIVTLNDRGSSAEHGDWRWETICNEHGGVASHETRALAESWLSHPNEWCEDCMYGEGTLAGDPPATIDAPEGEQKEAIMAAKTLTARESIEGAFAAGSEKKLKAAQVIERVLANPKSKISKGTIQTQLHRQSTKSGGWIKKVGPGTFQLQVEKVAKPKAEAKPDPKPSTRKRSSSKKTTEVEVPVEVTEALEVVADLINDEVAA